MLRILAEGKPIEPFDVRGFGRMPDTTTELHHQVRLLQKYEKTEGKPGWIISRSGWSSLDLNLISSPAPFPRQLLFPWQALMQHYRRIACAHPTLVLFAQ